jgi:hypothetical protein
MTYVFCGGRGRRRGGCRERTLEVVRMPIASSADTVLSILLLVILVLGYVVLWAIWHFFFRARDLEHHGDDRR